MDIVLKNRWLSPAKRTKFISLMEVYEQNYLRLRRLAPYIRHLQGDSTSFVTGCLDLHLSVLEQCKYTTIINLTYQFPQANTNNDLDLHRSQFEPNLEVRIYHDAKLAECRRGTFHAHVQNSHLVSENKWYLNRFLYKWLAYSLDKGHQFVSQGVLESVRRPEIAYLLTGVSLKSFPQSK